jgi:hypothetical protein
LTYAYIGEINRTILGGRLETLKSKKYPGGMCDLVKERRFVPSVRCRFCTDELKIQPFIEFMYTRTCWEDEATVYQGIRGDESRARSNMPRRVWESRYEAWIERPLFDWTAQQCFELMKKHGVEPNPLYRLGSSRVGCFPCVMTGKAELRRITRTCPEIWDQVATLESFCKPGSSFFRTDFIPARFHSGNYIRADGEADSFPTWRDVKDYLMSADAEQIRLWDRCTPSGCLSVYNLCE